MSSTSLSKLPRTAKAALDQIEELHFGFDRLTLWIDHPEPDLQTEIWEKYCAKVDIRHRSVCFQPTWQTKISIYQPGKKALRLLSTIIGNRWNTKVSYAEIAVDWLVTDQDTSKALQKFFLQHLYLRNTRHSLKLCRDTVYFKPRLAEDGRMRAHNVALYADKPSKLYSARGSASSCCHLEHRFSRRVKLGKIGLSTVQDCAAFSHRRFWAEHLLLATFSITDLGRLVEPDKPSVSPTMLRRYGHAFLTGFDREDVPILQDILVELRQVASAYAITKMLRPIDNRHFLKKMRRV